MARYFFALDINVEDKHAINHCCARFLSEELTNHKPIPPENFHITLAFLGDLSERQLRAFHAIAERLSEKLSPIVPSYLTFDHLGLFKKPQVLYLALKNSQTTQDVIPPWLATLSKELKNKALSLNIFQEEREYTPHISIARKAKTLPDVQFPVFSIYINSFSLYESISSKNGVKYMKMQQWHLTTLANTHAENNKNR